MITITPLQPSDISAAATLFIDSFKRLRQAVPVLPALMGDPQRVGEKLGHMLTHAAGLAAWEQDRLAGYITWFELDDFRDTGRKAAYVPEWGHGACEPVVRVYRALYRAAGERWQAAGCQTHAISLLAHDPAVQAAWFWSGFGLGVVDAVRPMLPVPLDPTNPASKGASGLTIRQADPADAAMLSELDAEHCRHYTAAPVFMTPRRVESPEEIGMFLSTPPNSMWLALDGHRPAGYLRFASASEGAAAIVAAGDAVANIGAYVRPEYRGRRAALALLNAAMAHYQQAGIACCSVDFESFNPEAADFWMRYFTPVCYSLFRVPENVY